MRTLIKNITIVDADGARDGQVMIENGKIRTDIAYSWDYGDEHGHLMFAPEISMQPGDRVELVVSHCDPTVNLFDELWIVKGEKVIDRWDITLRGCCR